MKHLGIYIDRFSSSLAEISLVTCLKLLCCFNLVTINLLVKHKKQSHKKLFDVTKNDIVATCYS